MWGQEWEKISGTKKVNRFRPPEVRNALAALELSRERLQLAADQVSPIILCLDPGKFAPFLACSV